MESSFAVLPRDSSVLGRIPLGIDIHIDPFAEETVLIASDAPEIPRCSRCRSFICSNSNITGDIWRCCMCSQNQKAPESIPSGILENRFIEVEESPECQPLQHIFVEFHQARDFLRENITKLNPNSPVSVYTYTDHFIELPLSPA